MRRSKVARTWARRWIAWIACLAVAAFAGLFAWTEYHPRTLALAEEAYSQGKLEVALRLAREHLARRPSNHRANELAASSLSRLGRPIEAEPYYQKLGPLDLQESQIRAYALVLHNDRAEAIRAYRELLDRWPDDVLALSRLAAVLISENRWDEVQEIALRLIRIPSAAVKGHTLAGLVHHNKGEAEESVTEYAQVLELDPELKQMPLKPHSDFWAQFGQNLLRIGRVEEARRYLLRALQEKNDPRLADLLGQAHFLQGSLDDAERCWRLTLQSDPERFGTWWRLGKLALQCGHPEEAVEPLRRSIELEPEAVGPLYCLSLAYRRIGKLDEARKLADRADQCRGKILSSGRKTVDPSVLNLEEELSRTRLGDSGRSEAFSTPNY